MDAVRKAAKTRPSLATKRVSPHVLRHSTAMHLLQSGVDITVIALWLGHESPETTHIYVEADLKTKEQALQNVAPAARVSAASSPATRCWPSWTPSDNAESTPHHTHASMPFAEFTRGYPVLGITFRTLVACPPPAVRTALGQIRDVAAA